MTKLKLKNLSLGTEADLDAANPLYASAMHELSMASITPRTFHTKTFWAQDDQDIMPLRSLEEYVHSAHRVVRFGISPSHIIVDPATNTADIMGEIQNFGLPMGSMNSQKYPRETAEKAILSRLEKDILLDAIRHPDQMVLVDIFERSNGTTINLDKKISDKFGIKQLVVDTVLLYKIL